MSGSGTPRAFRRLAARFKNLSRLTDMMRMETTLFKAALFAAFTFVASPMFAAELTDRDAHSTAPTGQTFDLRVLVVGSGSSHHFPRFFLAADSETLNAAGGIDAVATANMEEAVNLLPQADVLVFSGNHESYGSGAFQRAIREHAAAGKGIVLVHAALWRHPWEGYNDRFVGGGSGGHGFGEVEVTVTNANHPVMAGVPASFTVTDESYHHEFFGDAEVEVLAENGPDNQTRRPHASVWVVKDPETRIVCMTLGHDERAHSHPAYKKILTNAVEWVAAGPASQK